MRARTTRTAFEAAGHVGRAWSGQAKRRLYSSTNAQGIRSQAWKTAVVAVGVTTVAYQGAKHIRWTEAHAESASTREQRRAEISAQHVQVMRSWENPGVYLFGSNSGNVAAPESNETYVKTPRRLAFFDGQVLRDLKLDRTFAAAIDERGDLLQWGTAFSKETKQPTYTLRGKNLKTLALSGDRIIALSNGGNVYSVPVSKDEQESQPKPSSWLPFWSGSSAVAYRQIELPLGWTERVTDIKSGLAHCLVLTSAGRVFSFATSEKTIPSNGELGIPHLAWVHASQHVPDQAHEIKMLHGFNIAAIAAGDRHSLALDKMGRVFSFGDNSYGQCGFDYNSEAAFIPTPTLVPIEQSYMGSGYSPKVTGIFAGGFNTFFTIDATANVRPDPEGRLQIGKVSADVLACGQGLAGNLGNGRWTHIQGQPGRVKPLSGLHEYDEIKNEVVPIRIAHLSVGATHSAAVLNNITFTKAARDEKGSENDTNWGADALFWGGNEFYQLGTGKRNNAATPTYIPPLDPLPDKTLNVDPMYKKEEHRMHVTPRHTVKVNGRKVSMMQTIECGRGVSAVYSAT